MAPPPTTGIEDTVLAMPSRVAGVVAGIGSQALLAWWLGPEGRGSYAICLLFASILPTLFSAGVERGVEYHVLSGRLSFSDGFWISTAVVSGATALSVLAGWGLILLSPLPLEKADDVGLWMALLAFPFVIASKSVELLCVAGRRVPLLARLRVMAGLVAVAGIAVLTVGLGGGVAGAVAAYAISLAAFVAPALYDFRGRGMISRARLRLASLRSVLGYGLRYYPARLGVVFDQSAGILVLGFLATTSEIGLFAAISALCLRVQLISDGLDTALTPRLAGAPDGNPLLASSLLRLSALTTLAAMAVLCAISLPLVRILLSPAFVPGTPIIWILTPALVLLAAGSVLMTFFRCTNRPGICSIAVWSSVLTNVALIVALYPTLGILGAAWSMAAAASVRIGVLMTVYLRTTGQPIGAVLRPRRTDFDLIPEQLGRARDRLGLSTRGD